MGAFVLLWVRKVLQLVVKLMGRYSRHGGRWLYVVGVTMD
jgi:hypothetical protein